MTSRDMDNFEVVVSGKEVFAKHRCMDKGWKGVPNSVPLGRVVCCKDCGKHWFSKSSIFYETNIWSPVRWYHHKMRRAIVGK